MAPFRCLPYNFLKRMVIRGADVLRHRQARPPARCEACYPVMTKPNTAKKNISSQWAESEKRYFSRLKSPFAIQTELDRFLYRAESIYCCPRQVLKERKAHCYDGALFAAAALRFQGYPPLIVDLRSAENDDDHVLAVFRSNGCWGAVGKSNYVCLAWREPIYRTLRELALSYFEMYFNLNREKTLREVSKRPLDLRRYDRNRWMFENDSLERIAEDLDTAPHLRLLTSKQIKGLQLTDKRTYKAGTLGTNKKGCFDLG